MITTTKPAPLADPRYSFNAGTTGYFDHHENTKRLVEEVRANTRLIEDRDEDGKLWRVRRVSNPSCPDWVKDYAEGR